MTFRVSAAARADAESAIRAYNARPDRLGLAFQDEFDAAVAAVAAHPRMYSQAEDGIPGFEYREYYIARFQQRVIYLIAGDEVVVAVVVHAARPPGTWHRRIDLTS